MNYCSCSVHVTQVRASECKHWRLQIPTEFASANEHGGVAKRVRTRKLN